MKNLLFLLAFIMPLSLFSQDEKPYYMLESVQLTPHPQHLKTLSDNMAAHNKKYHPQGDYQAVVFNINTGLEAGDLVWMMGPTTWTEMEGRPGDDDHGMDWRDNVMAYTKGMVNSEYWTRNSNLVIDNRPDATPMNFYRLRYFTVNWGNGHRTPELMGKIKATLEAFGDEVHYWAVYTNNFIQGKENGRHYVAVTGFNSMSELDGDDWNFEEKFEEIHGENSWNNHMTDMNTTFDNWWDVWWSLNKKMSGMED